MVVIVIGIIGMLEWNLSIAGAVVGWGCGNAGAHFLHRGAFTAEIAKKCRGDAEHSGASLQGLPLNALRFRLL